MAKFKILAPLYVLIFELITKNDWILLTQTNTLNAYIDVTNFHIIDCRCIVEYKIVDDIILWWF